MCIRRQLQFHKLVAGINKWERKQDEKALNLMQSNLKSSETTTCVNC